MCLFSDVYGAYSYVAHAHAVDADAGRSIHDGTDAQLGFDGRVENGFFLLQVQHEAQLRQRQTGRPGQTEQRVVEVHRVAAETPVM